MFRDLVHGKWFAAAPLAMVVVLAGLYFGLQSRYTGCERGAGCDFTGLFQLDRSVVVDSAGAVVPPVQEIPPAAEAAVVERITKANESARVQMVSSAARRHSARLVAIFFLGLSLFASVAAFVVAYLMLRPAAGEPARRSRWVLAVVAGVAVIGLYFWEGHSEVTKKILAATVAAGGPLAEPGLPQLLRWLTAIHLGAAVALIGACTVLLLPSSAGSPERSAEPPGRFDGIADLRRRLGPVVHRLQGLRAFLFAATVLLVLGVLRMQAVMQWALSFVEPKTADALSGLAATVPSVVGAFYTLILIAVYVPSAYALHARADALISGAELEEEQEEEVRDELLPGESLTAAVPRVAALVAPLLAGPIATMMERL